MKVLIIGATGTIGSAVRQAFLSNTDADLTLFSRSAGRLSIDSSREKAISGNVIKSNDLDTAMKNQDVVFVALSGNLPSMAEAIVDSMKRNNVKKIIFISSMGIYNEIPARIGAGGNLNSNPVLKGYRKAADIIEESGLNYTVIRPGWFTSGPVNYEITHKGEPFGGHDVSVASIADLVVKVSEDPNLYSEESIGINTPE